MAVRVTNQDALREGRVTIKDLVRRPQAVNLQLMGRGFKELSGGRDTEHLARPPGGLLRMKATCLIDRKWRYNENLSRPQLRLVLGPSADGLGGSG